MNENKTKLYLRAYLVVIALTIGLSLSYGLIWAGWIAPSSSPSNSNLSAPINASSSVQTKEGSLKLNSIGYQNGLIVTRGYVGVGTIAPAAMLDIVGGLKVNYDGGICNADKAGTIQYNFFSKKLEYCNSISWVEFKTYCKPCVFDSTPSSLFDSCCFQ